MNGLAWEAVRKEFCPDGSLRDIYVFGTDIFDWQRMFESLRAAGYTLNYFTNEDQPTELPRDASQTFPFPGECDCRLKVCFAEVLANCHFFAIEEIEFDIDPRDVTGQQQLDALVGFMRCVARAVGKEVVFTAENCPEIVIFRVVPDEEFIEYHEFGGWHDWRE